MDDRNFDRKDAEEWISMIEAPGPKQRDKDVYPRIAEWVACTQPALVLEIGAGQGACSENIDLTDRTYIGLEPSPHLLDRAKHLYGSANRRFIQGTAYAIPFPSGSFDAAFSVMVWHLLSDIKKASLELGRALKPGGEFLIITTHPDFYPALQQETCGKDVLYFYTLDEMRSALELAGLVVTEFTPFRKQSDGLHMLISVYGKKPSTK